MFNLPAWLWIIIFVFISLIVQSTKSKNVTWNRIILEIIVIYVVTMAIIILTNKMIVSNIDDRLEVVAEKNIEYAMMVEERIKKEKQTNRAKGMIDGSELFDEICYDGSIYLMHKVRGSITPKYINNRVQYCHI